MWPHRQQLTRLHCPWDSPGKNTGVGCHFLLQCMKVKSEKWKVKVKSLSRVRLLATPWTAAYKTPLSMGFSRQEYWSGLPLPSPNDWLGKDIWCGVTKTGSGGEEKEQIESQERPKSKSQLFHLWPRATLSWSLSFFICKTGTITPTSESACCKQSAVNWNCFPFLSFFSKPHGKNHDQ